MGYDYAKMDLFFEGLLDLDGARAGLVRHKAKSMVKDTRVKRVAMSVAFGTSATIDLGLTPEDGARLSGSASFGGKRVALQKKGDGTWHARVEGVRVCDFDKPLVIEGACGGAFDVEASVLSYAESAFEGKKADVTTRQAMAAVWQLYSAGADLAKSR